MSVDKPAISGDALPGLLLAAPAHEIEEENATLPDAPRSGAQIAAA
jgi:hypothetical protein